MSVQRIFAVLLFTTVACGGTDVTDFQYGANQPGRDLPEGGEIRHENVRFFGQAEQTWLMVYQYTAPGGTPTAPFAAAADGGHGQFGNCVDERTGSPTWPFHPITGATYLDLNVQVTGPGITTPLAPPKTLMAVGNSTFRQHDFAYGGGGPNPMGTGPMGYNATLTAAQSTPGAEYSVDIGKKDQNGMLTRMTYNMPEKYVAPLGIGGPGPVMIPKGKDLVLEWTPPKNDFGDSGKDHTKKTFFNLTFFADPGNMTNPSQFLCFNDSDGHTTVPAAVVDLLPAGGLMVNANLAHWMEAREANPGEMRRFDLVTIFCNISPFMKQ